MASSPPGCLQRNDWICGDYLSTRADSIVSAVGEHVVLTGVSVALGLLLALPLGIVAFRVPRLRGLVLGSSTAIYTVPSLAMFSLLLPFTGLSARTVVVGLVLYSLTILVRNVLAGLRPFPRTSSSPPSAPATGRCPCCCACSCRSPCRRSWPVCASRPSRRSRW
jgi:osmoprotectant transport system permease protein